MKYFQHYLLTALFFIALLTPLLIMQISEEKIISSFEKRPLAVKPVLALTLDSVNKFPEAYEQYFNDHFGLRDQFVKFYNSLLISVFHTSPKAHTIVGKDKWLYHAGEGVLDDFLGLKQLSPSSLHKWKQVLLNREEWLADQGIKYLYLVPPNKVMIYPEYLPERYLNNRGATYLDQFLKYLSKTPVFNNTIDFRPLFLKAKKNTQVYYTGDTHWNYDGSYLAYDAIIDHIKNWFPELRVTPKERMERESIKAQEDLVLRLHIEDMYPDTNSILRIPGYKEMARQLPFEGYPQPDTEYESFKKGILFTYENPTQELTAIFIADSFGTALKNYMSQHFKRIVFVKDAHFEDILQLIKNEKPDVVFDITVARGMHKSLGGSREIRYYLTKKHFPTAKLLLKISPQNIATNHSKIYLLDISTANGPTTLISRGGDSQIHFDLSKKKIDGNLLIHCILTSSVNTLAKFYYQTPEHPYYFEGQVVYNFITIGKNNFYLRIEKPVLLRSIRFDPGEVAGEYTLESLAFTRE